jgi:hypothetical protein
MAMVLENLHMCTKSEYTKGAQVNFGKSLVEDGDVFMFWGFDYCILQPGCWNLELSSERLLNICHRLKEKQVAFHIATWSISGFSERSTRKWGLRQQADTYSERKTGSQSYDSKHIPRSNSWQARSPRMRSDGEIFFPCPCVSGSEDLKEQL